MVSGHSVRRASLALALLSTITTATLFFACGGDDDTPIAATISSQNEVAAVSEAPIGLRSNRGGSAGQVEVSAPRRYRSALADTTIISFYGHPGGEALGVLGEDEPERIAERLRRQAAAYTAVEPGLKVTPAFHVIYAVAQSQPQPDGSYLLRMTKDELEPYLMLARRNGFLVFLDLQIGRSTVEAEIERVRPFLSDPIVHLALDPEFTMPPGEVPGEIIGSMTADQINVAQSILNSIVDEYHIPNKILIVHEFRDGMIKGKERVRDYPGVDLVYDADGNGPQYGKLSLYDHLINNRTTRFAAIKLFYKHDSNLFEPSQILRLRPKPTIVIYQ